MGNYDYAEKQLEVILKFYKDSANTMEVYAVFNNEKIEFKDLPYIGEKILGVYKGHLGLKLQVIGEQGLNIDNLSNFIVNATNNRESNANYLLAERGTQPTYYSKGKYALEQRQKLAKYAETACSFVNTLWNLSDSIERYNNAEDDSAKAAAVGAGFSAVLGFASNAAGYIPGFYGDVISTTFNTAVQALNTGMGIINGYISRLKDYEAELDDIMDNIADESIKAEEITEIATYAEVLAPFINSSTLNDIKSLSLAYAEFGSEINNYEHKNNVDINSDNKVGGASYTPDNHGGKDEEDGGTSGGGNDAEDQFNDGENSRVDPIIVDLNNDGFNPSSLKNGTNFDLDANGMAERINWVQGDDAILAYDKNEDGIINDGTEVFGDNTVLENGKKAINGFEALTEFDSNNDGIINKDDELFDKLLIWQDINRNGLSEENELKTLDEIGIESLSLKYSNLNSSTSSGTVLGNVGSFNFKDGSTSRMAEYWVLSQKFNTVDKNPIDIPEDIAKLPNINAMGNVYSLHKAMTLDSTGRLVDMVKKFSESTDMAERKAIISDMLIIMANAENVPDGSRGSYVDAKKMVALEALLGQGFMGESGANPNSAAAPLVNGAYDTIVNMYYCELLAGTSLKDCLSYIGVVEQDGVKSLDFSIFCQYLRFNKLGNENGNTKIADAAAYINYLNNYYFDGCFDDFKAYFEENGTIDDLMNIDRAANTAVFGNDDNNDLKTVVGKNIVYGMGGDDIITGSSANDKLYGGSGDDVINGGAGNDVINGGFGDDVLSGGAGDDNYYFDQQHGNDIVNDNSGKTKISVNGANVEDYTSSIDSNLKYTLTSKLTGDTITLNDFVYNHNNYNFNFNGNNITKNINISEENTDVTVENIYNIINGTTQTDAINGGDFTDVIYAGSGDDIIDSGSGADIIYGNAGNDTFVLRHNHGDNVIFDNQGENTILFKDGMKSEDYTTAISYRGGFSFSNIETGDTVYVHDFLSNPLSYNFIFEDDESALGGGAGKEVVEGTSDNDYLEAADGFNIFYGGDGDDTLAGGMNIDFMYGGNGDDLLLGRNGTNILFGEDGNDTIYDGDHGSYLNGGNGDDMLYGGGGADVLDGGAGNDYLQGDHGNDTYIFGKGYDTDTIHASSDVNTIIIKGYSASSMINTRNAHNDLIIHFGSEDSTDCLIIDHFFDYNSNRDIRFEFDNGTVLGQYDIKAKYAPIEGTENSDWLGIQTSEDIIYRGYDGHDGIGAGNGNDTLDGGTGNDVLNGGNGTDTYIFAKGYGNDSINEWGTDKSIVKFTDINSDEVTIVDQWGNLLVTVNDTEDTLTINSFKWGQSTYSFEFADGAIASVNKDTFELEFSKLPDIPEVSEDEIAQSNAELLTELYAEDSVSTELVDNTIISEVTESTTVANETNEIADMTDIQVMVLTENMSAFADEANVYDTANMTDTTTDTALNQLLVNSAV